MDVSFSPENLSFKKEVQDFLAENWTDEVKAQFAGMASNKEATVAWQKKLFAAGWVAPNWPEQYGGPGWDSMQRYIFQNEMAEVGAPGTVPFGLSMVAPVIYNYGSEEQKKRFLPDILESNVWWCQGYSEPGSGSDLASLRTRAVLDGDNYIVNGSKTWTTLAQHADWIFCLVRTDNETKPQAGISFLLIDMKTPGIEVRPIITLGGLHHVNEVFFTDVKVPVENRIGEENKGWTYAKALLTHERTGIAGVARSKASLENIKKIASEPSFNSQSLLEEADFSAKVAQVEIDLLALEYTELRALAAVNTGGAPGPESSILKLKGVDVQQALTELKLEAAGYYALPYQDPAQIGHNEFVGPDFSDTAAVGYFDHRKASIYGGSTEVQKNIIAKAVLGL